MAQYTPEEAKVRLLAWKTVDYTSLSSLVLQLCCDLWNVKNTAGSFCAFGTINWLWEIQSQWWDWTITKEPGDWDYCITLAQDQENDCFPILLTVYEELDTRDSIEVHPYNQTTNSFCIHISEWDNGTAANVLRDRKFYFAIPCGDPVWTTIAWPAWPQWLQGIQWLPGAQWIQGLQGIQWIQGIAWEDGVVECPPMPGFTVPDFTASNLTINSQVVLWNETRDYFVLDANCEPKAVHKRYIRVDTTTTNLNTWNFFTIPNVAWYRTPCITVNGTYRQTWNPNNDDVAIADEPGAMPDAPYMGQEWTERSSTQRIYLWQLNNKDQDARYYTMVYVEYMQI